MSQEQALRILSGRRTMSEPVACLWNSIATDHNGRPINNIANITISPCKETGMLVATVTRLATDPEAPTRLLTVEDENGIHGVTYTETYYISFLALEGWLGAPILDT